MNIQYFVVDHSSFAVLSHSEVKTIDGDADIKVPAGEGEKQFAS